jgi:hypothetical protein
MNQDDSDMLSTSFLDVITCGLGSILLLFFLMVAIKGNMQFDYNHQSIQAKDNRSKAPLIVMITEKEGRNLWEKGVSYPWQETSGISNFAYKHISGPDYAILYVQERPPSNWNMKVGPFASDIRVNIQVIADGRQVIHESNAEINTSRLHTENNLQLWPLPVDAP